MSTFIPYIIAALTLLFSIYTYRRNRELTKKVFEYQKQKDIIEEVKKDREQKFQNVTLLKESRDYYEYVKTQFQYLDFTGLNAILQKPIKLKNIYIKLKTKRTPIVNQFSTIRDFEDFEKNSIVEGETFIQALETFFATRDKVRTPVRILIVGHPGVVKLH